MRLKPFFSYFGSKYRMAPRYPGPRYDKIIEPFAGSACYSMLYPGLDITLIEKNTVVAGVWRYLISANADRIMDLPTDFHLLSEVSDQLSEDEKNLIGFNLVRSDARPRDKRNTWNYIYPRSFWGEHTKIRIAEQLKYIRHWKIIEGDYGSRQNEYATWFIDAPYQTEGNKYGSRNIDYGSLSNYCKTRLGQCIVCESNRANWLPFSELHTPVKCGLQSANYSERVWIGQNPSVTWIISS